MFIVFPLLLFSPIYHFIPTVPLYVMDRSFTVVTILALKSIWWGDHSECRVFQFHHQYFGPQLAHLLGVTCLPAEGNHSHHLLKYGKNLTATAKQELKLLSIFFKHGE
jgi:hypothetical protein